MGHLGPGRGWVENSCMSVRKVRLGLRTWRRVQTSGGTESEIGASVMLGSHRVEVLGVGRM